jgi:YHS domain-containing protein
MKRRAALGLLALTACTRAGPVGFVEPPADGVTITCPVGRERCDKSPTTPSAVYRARTYYFCCPEGRGRFIQDPAKYADSGD